jgi:hypothetical protein
MRRLRRAASGLVVGLLVALSGGAAATAAPVLSADLQVTASQASGHVGDSVEVHLVVRNNGPSQVLAETWQLDIQAPPGTRLAGGSALAGNCNQSDSHAQCRYGFGLRRGERHELRLGLRIDGQPSGCGRAAVSYGLDNRDRNNAANIRVTVDGRPGSCSLRTSPEPRTSRSAAPTATPEAEITEAPPDDLPASVDAGALPAYPSNDGTSGGGLSLASILVIGGGLALVVFGGLLIYRLVKRDPDDDEGDDDDTAYDYPTYGGPQGGGYQPPGGYQGGRHSSGQGDETGPIYG